ncbi:hypothetical protein ACFX11_017813 [Malus domestica]
MGEVDIKWVKDNTFIITMNDESTATMIVDQIPWAVMKKNFSVKRWPNELALKEINMNAIPFWVQIRGVLPYMNSEMNIRCLASNIGKVEAVEDPEKARGFLRVKVEVDSLKPLTTGCWLPMDNNNESWIEFRYERLQDFCYRCGRIGHSNTECTFEPVKGSMAGYGEWTKTPQNHWRLTRGNEDMQELLEWGKESLVNINRNKARGSECDTSNRRGGPNAYQAAAEEGEKPENVE